MLVYKESSRRAHEDFINISMTLEMWLELDKIMKGMQNTVRCHSVIIRAKALPDRTITKKNMGQFREIKRTCEGPQGVELKFLFPEKCKIQLL